MAITDLRIAPHVAARLGAPTVDSLTTRLAAYALCPACKQQLGEAPVAVVGQQVGDRAVSFGAHAACRGSTWSRVDEGASLEMPRRAGRHRHLDRSESVTRLGASRRG